MGKKKTCASRLSRAWPRFAALTCIDSASSQPTRAGNTAIAFSEDHYQPPTMGGQRTVPRAEKKKKKKPLTKNKPNQCETILPSALGLNKYQIASFTGVPRADSRTAQGTQWPTTGPCPGLRFLFPLSRSVCVFCTQVWFGVYLPANIMGGFGPLAKCGSMAQDWLIHLASASPRALI